MAAKLKPRLGSVCLALALLGMAGSAAAQNMSTNAASFNAGWNRNPGDENRAVDPNTRDANGNRVIINGQIMSGSDQSAFSFGAASAFAGAGAGGATAIGNSLSVITQGDNNVVIVDSTQTNSGDVIANSGANHHGS
jgi:holdfast attachment protein HfaA